MYHIKIAKKNNTSTIIKTYLSFFLSQLSSGALELLRSPLNPFVATLGVCCANIADKNDMKKIRYV